MAKTPTPDQVDRVARIMPHVRRLCIDKTGMGLPIFESMDRMFPGKVEGISFKQATKEAMATKAKRRLEEKRFRLPNDPVIWQSFRSVRKSVTSVGQVRFDATHDEKYGHADHWWAFCLAEAAFTEQPSFGLFEYWRTQAEAIKAGASGTTERSDIDRTLARAQRSAATGLKLFGANRFGVNKVMPHVIPTILDCPRCKKPCAVYGEVLICRDCDWRGHRSA